MKQIKIKVNGEWQDVAYGNITFVEDSEYRNIDIRICQDIRLVDQNDDEIEELEKIRIGKGLPAYQILQMGDKINELVKAINDLRRKQ